jgi:translation initiation factor eIF-2B subunit beta
LFTSTAGVYGLGASGSGVQGKPGRQGSADGFFGSVRPGEWEAKEREKEEFMKTSSRLKPVLVQAIDEVVNELETTHEDVARGAREHVHSS